MSHALIASFAVALALVASSAQAQNDMRTAATESGLFIGATATQFDGCVRQGFLSANDKSAEAEFDMALSSADKIMPTDQVPQRKIDETKKLMQWMREGWEGFKQQAAKSPISYTSERCQGIGQQWTAYRRQLGLN
jgi:hypothetical protein